MAWIDLSEDYDFNDNAFRDFKPGMIMRFDYEGSITEMKIMRIDKPKVWVKEVRTLSLKEFEKEMDKRRKEAQKLTKKQA